jgi:flagellar motility protein MotE (MotC chaperone)
LLCVALLLSGAQAFAAGPVAPVAPVAPAVTGPKAPFPEVALPSNPFAPGSADAGVKSGDAGTADGGTPDEPVRPPSLTQGALCQELILSVKELASARARLDEERKALAAERAVVERQAQELDKARTALRQETADLKALLDLLGVPPTVPAVAKKAGKGAPADKKGKSEYDMLAKTMRAMNPDQAAVLVSQLERPVAIELLKRMRPAEASAVLERLKPELAVKLISAMAVRAGRREGRP